MPKYYFNVNERGISDLHEPQEMPSDEAAWHEATLVAGEMFRDASGAFKLDQEWKLEVIDEQLSPLYNITVIGKDVR